MKKVLGLTLIMLFAFTLAAAAEQALGTVKEIDRAEQSVILDDGTKLWVSDSNLANLAPGDEVQAMFETKDGKKVVTDLQYRTGARGSDFGTLIGTPIDPNQSE